ncbi:MAG: hypothetical protein WC966_02210 [Bradymonadales bacterium]|jgi:hypothetical protein
MKSARLIWLFLFALALSLSAVSCAGMQRQSMINSYVNSHVESYEYNVEFSRLWAEARALLFNRGYQVRDSGNGYVVETEWSHTTSGNQRRYLVTGYRLSDTTSKIKFDYNENDSYGSFYSSGRDLQIEGELIQRLEPQRWNEIQAQAAAYADANMKK